MNTSENSAARARWRELIGRHLLGNLTADETRELESALSAHREARDDFRCRCNVDAALRREAAALEQNHAAETAADFHRANLLPGWFSWFSFRPLTTAAAGVILGVFCASVVWAYVVPGARSPITRTIEVLSEGFENSQEPPGRGFPKRANVWSGDMFPSSPTEAGVEPMEGNLMMRLTPKAPRKLGYAWRLVDLADFPAVAHAKMRRLEVSASFNTPSSLHPSHYQVRLAALSQEPAAVRGIWNNEPVLFDTVLQHIGRNLLTKPGDQGWKSVQASLEIPPGTRSIVISLAAGEADPEQPPGNHYLDNVHARFVIARAPGE